MEEQLHIVLFPVMAHGHMIPMVEMAKMFISRGLRATIITTAPFADPVNRARQSGLDIGLSTLKFPPDGSSLPDNVASLDQVAGPHMFAQFMEAMEMLQEPVQRLLQDLSPNCLISDMFLPWTVDPADKLGIPRLVFHGTCSFSMCLAEQMHIHKPYKNLESDDELFVVPGLPHEFKFALTQVSPFEKAEEKTPITELLEKAFASKEASYGVVMNSFYELEPDYVEYDRNVKGTRAWHIGPLLLCNNGNESKAQRGKKSAIDEHECLAWLDSKKPNSVVYMCFGSTATFSPAQLHEMAVGLEASNQDFIWAVRRRGRNQEEDNEDWMPQGFEERMKGKGLIIRGWAPQLMILDHPAVGGFVTHCGWNSTLEGICAGVPMVTWPVFAEQFFNEKLVTEILKTGVSVGNRNWCRYESDGVPSESVAKAIKSIMDGEDAAAMEMRSRAKNYKEMARKAVQEGGSSYNNLDSLIQELRVYQPPRKHDIHKDDARPLNKEDHPTINV